MTQTKGEFLKEKLTNMARWVQGVAGEELPADFVAGIERRTELECVAMAATLESNKRIAIHRDWVAINKILVEQGLTELQTVLVALRQRPQTHDKFWRYVDLFIEVSSQ